MSAPGGEGAKSGLTIIEVGAESTVNFNNFPKKNSKMQKKPYFEKYFFL